MKNFVFVLALLFGLCSVSHAAAVSTTTITAGRIGIFGVNSGLYASSATWLSEIAIAVDLGAGQFRSNFDGWARIETTSGTFVYGYMDWIMDTLTANGLRVNYITPAASPWTPDDPSCRDPNPFNLQALGDTHCQTSDMGLVNRYMTNIATRYADRITLWEIWNEPDYYYGSTNPAVYVQYATTAISAIIAVDPDAEIVLPAIASPKATVLNGNITDGTTTYLNHHWFSAFLAQFSAALPPTFTMSSVSWSFHNYYEGAGGNQTFQLAMTTMSAMLANVGVSNPVFHVTEYGAFGGTPANSFPAYEVRKASVTMQFFAIAMSSNPAYSGVVKTLTYHNINGYDFSATTTSYAYRPVANVLKELSELNGYTAMGDQGNGSTVRIYKFVKGAKAKYICWTESGTSSWALNPTGPVSVTDVNGVTKLQSASAFTPYTLTTSPILVEEISGYTIRNVAPTGGTLQ